MKSKKIISMIFAIIILMPVVFSQVGMCTTGNCPFSDPRTREIAKSAYGTSIDAPDDSLYNIGDQQLLDANGKPLLPPAPDYPRQYAPSFGNGKASFSGSNSLTTPQGTYPSTNLQGMDQSFTQSLGAVQGIIQLLGQLNLKELIVPKEKKDLGQSGQTLPSPGFSEVELTNIGDKTNTKFKDTMIGLSDDKNYLVSDTNDDSKYGEITTIGDSLKSSTHFNTATTISTAGKSIAKVETNDKTNIILDNPAKEDAFGSNTLITLILSLLEKSFISAQQESGQYVKFSNQNVEINGHDISVHALKTFENLQAGGNNLEFYSGENLLEFNQQRILFSRLLTNNPHGVNSISNKLDPNNKYKLQHYTNSMGKLYDDKDIVYVTDITTNPEKGPYANLKINKDRMEMFS